MRRSLILRIVALAALLGVIGAFASGCSGIISIIIGWGPAYFEEYVAEIGQADWYDLAYDYYADPAFVDGEGWLRRNEVAAVWKSYFEKYQIDSSYLISVRGTRDLGHEVEFEVYRREERRERYFGGIYGSRQILFVTERYRLERFHGDWLITGVWEISTNVY